ncbi:MAG TPA: DUF503 domain-containing protein [Firmicutes bacterium]|nr:DUF503 domain-containing protein [Bacillota bacterium]
MPSYTGLLTVELYIPAVQSLKEKRKLIKSLLTRLRNKYNVSLAETDYNDKWQRSIISVVAVSNSPTALNSQLDKVINYCFREKEISVVEYSIQII